MEMPGRAFRCGAIKIMIRLVKSDHDLISLFEHDLFGKPVPTFPDHALSPDVVKPFQPLGDDVAKTLELGPVGDGAGVDAKCQQSFVGWAKARLRRAHHSCLGMLVGTLAL